MTKLTWIYNRLKCMSMPEIAYRAYRQLGISCEQSRWARTAKLAVPEPTIGPTDFWIPKSPPIKNKERYIQAANEILKGHLSIFQADVDAYQVIQNWNQDPKSLVKAPMIFGKKLDYRNESLVGDIKYLWEPNRHLHLVTLAQAYFLTGNRLYGKAFMLHLRSWIDQCPHPLGPNWSSSLEGAIRLINWSIAWQLIGGCDSQLFTDEQGKSFRSDWLESIFQHMYFISGHFSRYSSANNHLIGEAAGLFVGANTWPYWHALTDRWRSDSQKILLREAQKQIHPDGGTCEQAISYQQFVLDFLILSLLSARPLGITFPETYLLKIETMIDFISALMDCKGNMPMIGDADDGFAVH